MDFTASVSAKLSSFPKLSCGVYPTPIEELPRFRETVHQNAPRILIKRDDYTGAGFGGNKVRKLEFLLAQALLEGRDTVITIGGEKSNHARVTAALCARLGLHCHLVLSPAAIKHEGLEPASLIVERSFGAEIHRVSSREERIPMMRALAEELRSQGECVVEVPLGASIPLGALGFIHAMREAADQLQSSQIKLDYIFHACSSGGTQAGLIAGAQLLGMPELQIIGVSPDDPAESIAAEVQQIIRGVTELLELPAGTLREEVTVLDDYIGEGYGIPSPESDAALNLLAKTEGILLDPVYTAKAMAGLIDWVHRGKLTKEDTVLFWHTGGQLASFYAPLSMK